MTDKKVVPSPAAKNSKKRCRTCSHMNFLMGCLDFTCELTGDTRYLISPHTVVCDSWKKNRIDK